MPGKCAKTLAIGLIFTGSVFAGSVIGGFDTARAQSMTDILECREVDEQLERLACFDRTTGFAAEAALSAETEQATGEPTTVAQAAPAPSADDLFGSEDLVKSRKKEEKDKASKSLRAKLVSLSFTNSGKYVITLDNGQVWRQIQGDTGRLSLSGIDGNGVPIIINKGALGSHRMRTVSSKRTIRVERVQ